MPGGNQTQPSDDLEAKARDFLFSDELADKNEALAKRFDLKEKAQDDLASAQNAVVFKEMSLPDFIDTVKRIAVLNKKSSVDFLDAVAESFLFPLDEYLNGEPKKLLEKNKSSSYSVIPSPSSVIPAKAGIQSASIGSPIEPVLERHRGPGMTNKASASQVVIRSPVPRPREHTDLTKIMAAPEKAVVRAPMPRPKEEVIRKLPTTHYSLPTNNKPLTEAEDQELAKMKEKAAGLPRPSQSNETLVEKVLAKVQFPFKDDIQKTRFINAVKNRMRDIRDQFETKELLLRSENLGGVGLAEPVAEQASNAMEKIIGEQSRRQIASKKEEFQMAEAQTKQMMAAKTQSRVNQALEEQNTRYKNLVTVKIKSVLERPLGFLKKKAVPTAEVPETIMSKRESAKITVPLPRPKMEDIKFRPTLVGPIEELKNFTLKDWQSLGAKSSIISQKLSVLRNESYAKYITALASFKESPLFALAQEILDESLAKNTPLAGAIEMRKKEGKPYLSENEINDILSIE